MSTRNEKITDKKFQLTIHKLPKNTAKYKLHFYFFIVKYVWKKLSSWHMSGKWNKLSAKNRDKNVSHRSLFWAKNLLPEIKGCHKKKKTTATTKPSS